MRTEMAKMHLIKIDYELFGFRCCLFWFLLFILVFVVVVCLFLLFICTHCPPDSSWSVLRLSSPAFECVCSLLLDQFQDTFSLPHDMVKSMLNVVAMASSSLLEVSNEEGWLCFE